MEKRTFKTASKLFMVRNHKDMWMINQYCSAAPEAIVLCGQGGPA